MAKHEMGTGSNACRLDGHIGCTLAIAHDNDPLAAQLLTRLECRHVDDLAFELIPPFEEGNVRRLRVESDTDHGEVEVLDCLSRTIAVRDPPSRVGHGSLMEPENRA